MDFALTCSRGQCFLLESIVQILRDEFEVDTACSRGQCFLLESIVQILRDEFEVDTALNGEDGLFLALQNIYDAILLDVMMPEMDGFEVIQKYVMKRLKRQSCF